MFVHCRHFSLLRFILFLSEPQTENIWLWWRHAHKIVSVSLCVSLHNMSLPPSFFTVLFRYYFNESTYPVLFINPTRFTFLSRKLNSFGLKNLRAEAICWLRFLKQEIKKNISNQLQVFARRKLFRKFLMSIEYRNYTSVHLIKWMTEIVHFWRWK